MVLPTICWKYIILSSLQIIFATERRAFEKVFYISQEHTNLTFFHWLWIRESATYAKIHLLTEVLESAKKSHRLRFSYWLSYCPFSFPKIHFITKYSYLWLFKCDKNILKSSANNSFMDSNLQMELGYTFVWESGEDKEVLLQHHSKKLYILEKEQNIAYPCAEWISFSFDTQSPDFKVLWPHPRRSWTPPPPFWGQNTHGITIQVVAHSLESVLKGAIKSSNNLN